MRKALALCGLLLIGLIGVARPAQAEWQFAPMAGVTMLGSTSLVDPEFATGLRHPQVGFGVSLLSGGIIGAEVLTHWTPGFFENGNVFRESSRTVVVMGNVVLTGPRRWTEYSLRPFLSGGFGLIHAAASEVQPGENIFPISVNAAGFNIGGGAVGFLTERTGLRFDVRYHSTLNRAEDAPSFGPVHLGYVTASIGLVFRR